jgi:hypothetical protein
VVDPKCEAEPLIYLRRGKCGDQIILNQKIEHTTLDLNAGNLNALDIHPRLTVARFDPNQDGDGTLSREEVLCSPARRFSGRCLPQLHEVHQRVTRYFAVGEFQTGIAKTFREVCLRLRVHPGVQLRGGDQHA